MTIQLDDIETYGNIINQMTAKISLHCILKYMCFTHEHSNYRNSHQRCFVIGVLRNFAKFTGNTCARFTFLVLLKKRFWHRCVLVNFAKFLKKTFFTERIQANASVARSVKSPYKKVMMDSHKTENKSIARIITLINKI